MCSPHHFVFCEKVQLDRRSLCDRCPGIQPARRWPSVQSKQECAVFCSSNGLQRSLDADAGAGPCEPAAAPAGGDAQDTPQAQAAAAVWDLCASRPAAAFMLDNQLLDLAAALLQRCSGSADGASTSQTPAAPHGSPTHLMVTMWLCSVNCHPCFCSHRCGCCASCPALCDDQSAAVRHIPALRSQLHMSAPAHVSYVQTMCTK